MGDSPPATSRSDVYVNVFVGGLVVLILAALVTVSLTTVVDGHPPRDMAVIKLLEDACRSYRVEFGTYPTQDPDLGTRSLVKALSSPRVVTVEGWKQVPKKPLVEFGEQMLLNGQVVDTRDKPFRYRCPGVRNPNGVDIEAPGKNGSFGDDDDLWNRPD